MGYGPNEISASQSSEITGLHISNSFRTDDPCTSIDTCDVDHQPPTIDLESMIYASNLVVTTTSIRSLKLYALTNVDQYFLLRDNNGLVEVFAYLLVEYGGRDGLVFWCDGVCSHAFLVLSLPLWPRRH